MIAGMEGGDARTDGLDDANALMTENAPRRACRHVALEDVEIGPADGRVENLHQSIAGIDDRGRGMVVERFLPRTMIDERLHQFLPHIDDVAARDVAGRMPP